MNILFMFFLTYLVLFGNVSAFEAVASRRDVLKLTALSPLVVSTTLSRGKPANAAMTPTGSGDGNLPDLPPEAVRSYLQYRIPLQTAADFYVFELQDLLRDPSDYGEVNVLFEGKNNRGQGIPSRIEREFSNVFRIIGLSMPPDVADEMRDAQFKFEKGMAVSSLVWWQIVRLVFDQVG